MAISGGRQIERAWALIKAQLGRFHSVNLAIFDQAVVSGANFATGIVFARFLGIAEFGRFTLAWIVVEFTASLQYAAILQPMLNIGPKQPEHARTPYYDSALLQQVAFSLGCALLVGLGAAALNQIRPQLLIGDLVLPLGIAVAGHQLQYFLRRFFFCRERPGIAFTMDVTRYVLQLGVAFLWAGFPQRFGMLHSADALWMIAGSAIAAASLGLFFIGRVSWPGPIMVETARRHWHFAKWLLPSAALFLLSGYTSVVVAGGVLGAAAAGALNAAKTSLGVINVMLLALDNFAPSQAARTLHQSGKAAMWRYVAGIGVVVGSITVAIAVAISINPAFFMRLFYGPQYEGFGYLACWFSVAYVLFSVSTVLVIAAAAQESATTIFLSYAVAAAVTLILSYPATRLFGLPGAGAIIVLAEICRLGMLSWRLLLRQKTTEAPNDVPVPPKTEGHLA